jgi:hypothetical protein
LGGIVVYTTLLYENNDDSSISLAEYNQHTAHAALSNLHYLKIGEAKALEDHLVEIVPLDAKMMNALIESGIYDSEDNERFTNYLVLLAVMDEKINIPSWRTNTEFQSILGKVRRNHKSHADRLRCRNWSRPMWLEPDDCA